MRNDDHIEHHRHAESRRRLVLSGGFAKRTQMGPEYRSRDARLERAD
jgi:hypothetical protein